MNVFGYMFGGIGVFFVGLNLLSAGLKQMAGRRFRINFAKWVGSNRSAGAVGFVAGFLSQSMSALSFIVSSLVGAGMMPAKRGIVVILWANAGMGIMILLAVLNIETFVLFVLGLAGISFAFKKPRGMQLLSQVFFGGGMLFYGLIMLRAGAAPLADMPWFESILVHSHSSFILSFLAGALLTALCQSSTAVSILAISLTQVGMFSMEQTIMIIYGTNVGSGVVSWIFSHAVKGTPKQLIMSQALFNILTAMVFVPLFYIEYLGDVPLVAALIHALNLPLEQKAALVFLLFNWGGAITISLVLDPFYRGIARFWPATSEEEWSKPKYLRDDIEAPEIAAALLEKEQKELACRLKNYSEILLNRDRNVQERQKVADALHSSFRSISTEIASQAEENIQYPLSPAGLELIIILQNKQKQLDALEELLYNFGTAYEKLNDTVRQRFEDTFLQGLDFLLATVCEVEKSSDPDDARHLAHLTRDKGEVFQSLRTAYLREEEEMDSARKKIFLEITSRFERIVWTLGRIANLQRAQNKFSRMEQDSDSDTDVDAFKAGTVKT